MSTLAQVAELLPKIGLGVLLCGIGTIALAVAWRTLAERRAK